MRVVFVNLHSNEMLVKNLSKIIFKQSIGVKQGYLLQWLIDNPNIEVCNLITKDGFSMGSSYGIIGRLLNILRFWENRYILKKNNIERTKITVLKSPADLKEEDIVLLNRAPFNTDVTPVLPGFKAISMIHFGGNEHLVSEFARKIGVDVIFNEFNLEKFCKLFQKSYGWYKKPTFVTSFVFQDRFKPIVPFSQRENKAFATGTITYRESPDFLEVYKNSCVQPSRKQIKEHSEDLKDYITCTCSDYSEGVTLNKLPANANFLQRVWYTYKYKSTASQQKSYYSFDMVEMFNKYKMCIIGEEVLPSPGIGFVEGMACGCAYIGLNNGLYEEYGMQEGVHYIGYNGSLTDLKYKIAYYQAPEHQAELEAIAKTGCEFIRANFNGPAVAEKLITGLVKLRDEKLNEKNAK